MIFFVRKTKRRLHDRKTDHFKALPKGYPSSSIADHFETTGHNIKWDHSSGKTDYHCKVQENLFIQELQPALKVNVRSEKLFLYQDSVSILCDFTDSFLLKRLKFLLQMFSVQVPDPRRQSINALFKNFDGYTLKMYLDQLAYETSRS